MIKGAIEKAGADLVSGWIYSEVQSVSGKLVLAFIGNVCVGSGKVQYYRKDLQDAGLGDGHNGFYFPVKLAAGDDPAAIVVRLDQCDAVLVQSAFRGEAANRSRAAAGLDAPRVDPDGYDTLPPLTSAETTGRRRRPG